MTHATPPRSTSRSTSIQVTRAESDLARHVAEDMHGFQCFIDADSAIESPVFVGMILHADIDHAGLVVRGHCSGPQRS